MEIRIVNPFPPHRHKRLPEREPIRCGSSTSHVAQSRRPPPSPCRAGLSCRILGKFTLCSVVSSSPTGTLLTTKIIGLNAFTWGDPSVEPPQGTASRPCVILQKRSNWNVSSFCRSTVYIMNPQTKIYKLDHVVVPGREWDCYHCSSPEYHVLMIMLYAVHELNAC